MRVMTETLKSAARRARAWAWYASSWNRGAAQGELAVLMYHRVLTQDEVMQQAVEPGMYVLADVFAEQMAFVKEHCAVLSMQDLLGQWRTGTWDEGARYCVITFDDGWWDNYRHAYPVLKRLGMPATIFLPTDFVGTDQWFWPDQLSWLLKAVAAGAVSPARIDEGRNLLDRCLRQRVGALPASADQLIALCKPLTIERIRELIDGLSQAWQMPLPTHRVVVDWDEVRDMSRHGLSFGSHSCSHRILTTISAEEVTTELARSKDVLLNRNINYVPVFCYPNGNHTPEIERQTQAAGYEAAVSVRTGRERRLPANPYAVKRVGIHNDITNSIPLFAYRAFGPSAG